MPKKQYVEFQELAKSLGCDDSEAAFDAKLKRAAHAVMPEKAIQRARAAKPKKVAKAVPTPAPPKKKIKFNLPGA